MNFFKNTIFQVINNRTFKYKQGNTQGLSQFQESDLDNGLSTSLISIVSIAEHILYHVCMPPNNTYICMYVCNIYKTFFSRKLYFKDT